MDDKNALTVSQTRKLAYLEQQIAKGASDIYQALRLIHDEKLYRGAHATFEGYCLERWKMGRAHANRLIQHGQVLQLTDEEMSPIGDKFPKPENAKTFTASELLKEAHTREVAGLPDAEDARHELLCGDGAVEGGAGGEAVVARAAVCCPGFSRF